MLKRNWILFFVVFIITVTSACQSKKIGCPGSFHHKAFKNTPNKTNV